MSNEYDPWKHALNLFMNRLLLFVFLAIVLGLATWVGLLHWKFEASWLDAAQWTWKVVREGTPIWRVALAQSLAIGALLTAWLFSVLILRGRLRRGDRYHRGARVVHHRDEE